MDIHKAKEYKKILIVAIILGVLLLVVFFVRRQKQLEMNRVLQRNKMSASQNQEGQKKDQSLTGVYKITPDKSRIKVGEIVTVKISFQAPEKIIFGTDIRLSFDPKLLQAEENILLEDVFQSYPRREVDNVKGSVKVTGFMAKDQTVANDFRDVLTISFKALQSGVASLNLDFEKGKTNLSTLVEKGSSKNVLGKVIPVEITIE